MNNLGRLNPLRYRGYVYDVECNLYYLQSRYYDPAIGRFINADNYPSTGQVLLGNNMFAYCGNNPVHRFDLTGQSWVATTLLTIGIGTLSSVATSAALSWMTGEKFTIGDAIGAATEGFLSTSMSVLKCPAFIAEPLATFSGEVVSHFVDGDTSQKAIDKIHTTTFQSGALASASDLVGYAIPKLVDDKCAKPTIVGRLLKKATYQAKYLNESCIQTIASDNFWSSVKDLIIDLVI